MKEEAKQLLQRIYESPSCYHVIHTVRNLLIQQGYLELSEKCRWKPVPGGGYFTVRNESSLIAFRIPQTGEGGFRIAAAHSDSPTFKLKEKPEKKNAHYVQLNTEKYGGMLMGSWFDRPLSIAGRVFLRENQQIVQKLVNIDRDLLIIPGVAIHMNRNANDGMNFRANVDTLPLYGAGDSKSINTLVAETLEIPEGQILGNDLFLYCRDKGTLLGVNEEYIASPKLDDLMCAFGCLEGFLRTETSNHIPVLGIFDNEEVGSSTKQGAASTFLRDVLRRIVYASGGTEEDYMTKLAKSFMVSADNAHAQHPNHPEYADADNCPYMNGGIVIKFNANQKYTTDGYSSAVFRSICEKAGVRTQVYANRSDLPGGSTLGSISNTMVSVNTVDIGLAQLAMHSAYETAGAEDYSDLIRAMTVFFESEI